MAHGNKGTAFGHACMWESECRRACVYALNLRFAFQRYELSKLSGTESGAPDVYEIEFPTQAELAAAKEVCSPRSVGTRGPRMDSSTRGGRKPCTGYFTTQLEM